VWLGSGKMHQSIRRVQYASSLYVDTFEKVVGAHFVKPAASVLVLAGQIGKTSSFQTQAFLNHCSRLWNHVVYVPSVYDGGVGGTVASVASATSVAANVHILDNQVTELGDVAFVGSQYRTERDVSFVDNVFDHYKYSNKRLVAITSLSVVDEWRLLPPYNLWLCGHSPGGRVLETRNGVLVAYNSRGSISDQNDFDGSRGWRRDAVIDIPDNYWGGSTLELLTSHEKLSMS